MRHFVIILAVVLAACVAASSSPIDPKGWLVNRPSPKDIFTRVRRAEPYVKGRPGKAGTKIGQPLELNVRKGEYICGNKVCKLKPGEKPPCPVCQYPI